jgi:iron only hydrogenase large subunit-like protein
MKLLDILHSKEKIVIVSVSPQSVASLAAFLELSQIETFLKIATYFKALGVRYVLDTSSGGDISLLESRKEFLERFACFLLSDPTH